MRKRTMAIVALVASLLIAMVVAAPVSANHTGARVSFQVKKNDAWIMKSMSPYDAELNNVASTTYTLTITVPYRSDYNLLKRFFGNPVVATIPATDTDGFVQVITNKGPWEAKSNTETKPYLTAHPAGDITVTTTFVKGF